MEQVEEKTNLKNNKINENISTFKKIKKVLNYIGKVLSYASIVLLVIIGAFLLYYLFTMQKYKNDPKFKPEVSLYTIISGSMEPAIHVYDVVVNLAVKSPEDIKVGDVITFESTSSISNGLTVTHRVQDIKIVNGRYEYVTKGDYNPVADSSTAKYENVLGKVAFKIPQLGRVQFIVASKAGWFLVVLLPAMGVIIYDVIKLIKLLGAKATTDKVNQKNKRLTGDKDVDKALDSVIKKDYSSTLEELQNDIKDNNLINNKMAQSENIVNEENKPIVEDKKEEIKVQDKQEEIKVQDKQEEKIDNNVKDEVHITKQDYLNRLNALKNKK